MLVSLVLVMLIGSFLAGSIPLFFSFSEVSCRALLVFCRLDVSLKIRRKINNFRARSKPVSKVNGTTYKTRNSVKNGGFFLLFFQEKLKKITVLGAGLLVGTALAVIIPEGVRSLTIEGTSHASTTIKAEEHHAHEHSDPLSVIGISLVLGFVFMVLVDQVSWFFFLEFFRFAADLFQISQSKNENLNPQDRNITATIGLVVHAAADGVALGAAATTSHADVEIIVFLAIMLHKAPAAFGLVTFLLHEGIER